MAKKAEFRVGESVKHRSGGLLMTVCEVESLDDSYEVTARYWVPVNFSFAMETFDEQELTRG